MTVLGNIPLGPIDSHYGGRGVDTVQIRSEKSPTGYIVIGR